MPHSETESHTDVAEPVQRDFPARDTALQAGMAIPFQREDEDDFEPTIVLGRE